MHPTIRSQALRPLFSRWSRRRHVLAAVPAGGPPPPTCDLIVTDAPAPDCTGNYDENGTQNGYPRYERQDHAFWIWRKAMPLQWVISQIAGTLGTLHWKKTSDPVTGTYNPQGTATGTATVAAP